MRRLHWTILLTIGLLAFTACNEPEAPGNPDEEIVEVVEPAEIKTKTVKTYWDPEETLIKEEYSVVEGAEYIKHGLYKFYTKNQVLSMEHNYVNGHMEGEIREYYESGKLWITYEFTNGAPNGPFLWYHENGEIMLKGTYDNGVYADTLWEYDELGNLLTTQTEFEQMEMGVEGMEFD